MDAGGSTELASGATELGFESVRYGARVLHRRRTWLRRRGSSSSTGRVYGAMKCALLTRVLQYLRAWLRPRCSRRLARAPPAELLPGETESNERSE
eukprot:1065265-Rhodomonas_salina.1